MYDIGTFEGAPYLVCELLEGDTLRERLGQGMPVRKATELAIQIARGLAAAHDRGIVLGAPRRRRCKRRSLW